MPRLKFSLFYEHKAFYQIFLWCDFKIGVRNCGRAYFKPPSLLRNHRLWYAMARRRSLLKTGFSYYCVRLMVCLLAQYRQCCRETCPVGVLANPWAKRLIATAGGFVIFLSWLISNLFFLKWVCAHSKLNVGCEIRLCPLTAVVSNLNNPATIYSSLLRSIPEHVILVN